MANSKIIPFQTYPGIIVAPIGARIANELLRTSKPASQTYLAGLTRFLNLTEEQAQAMIARHRKFGYFKYPVIPKDQAQKSNSWNNQEGVSTQQKYCKTAKESLASALFAADNNFNTNTDYVYFKLDITQ